MAAIQGARPGTVEFSNTYVPDENEKNATCGETGAMDLSWLGAFASLIEKHLLHVVDV